MKLDLLDRIEQHLSKLIETPFRAFFPNNQAGLLLAKRLVEAMSDNLGVDEGGRLTVPVYYEIHLNPIHAALWRDPPDLTGMLTAAINQAAREQGVTFELHPVINVTFDGSIGLQDIRVTTLDESELAGATTETPAGLPAARGLPEEAFLIINGDRHLALDQPVITIGRAESNQLVFNDPQVSRLHAQLRIIDGTFHIFDLDSASGTLVNGKLIQQVALFPGDVIEIGDVSMVYGQESPAIDDTAGMPAISPAEDPT
ncbi:MAG: FhaA domain-containing protein [Anaerolineaceae bacterium]